MVGGLGGLGRSLARWMRSRGAECFVFLSRSGIEKPDAHRLVEELKSSGASVEVIKGDVSLKCDVERFVAAAVHMRPIGGVIHAAMGLSVSHLITALIISFDHQSGIHFRQDALRSLVKSPQT